MIRISRPELEDPEWAAWRKDAQAAMDELIASYRHGNKIAINAQFYQDAKPFLKRLFHGKCAYCETVIASNQPGDVEHYRPKGQIRTKDGVVTIEINKKKFEHPGYWWLAYQWTNLLPSCIDCNRRRQHDNEQMLGKADLFDIRGKRACLPTDDLKDEKALLLDPADETFDPAAHFEFEPDGTIRPLTEDAEYSCELLGLNLREKLVSQRQAAYVNAQRAVASYVQALVFYASASVEALEPHRTDINRMWKGESEYSAFSRRAIQTMRDRFRAKGGDFQLPIP